MSDSQISKLKLGILKLWELKTSSNVVGDSNDDNSFPHKLPLTNTQVLRLCKAFANG